MSRFVQPEATVLRISQGDTLTVRKRLNVGEQRAMFDRWLPVNGDGARPQSVDQLLVGVTQVAAYLIDWSLTDAQGAHVDIRDQPLDAVISIINALEIDDFREIREAIEAHIDAQAVARAQEKKVPTGESDSSATSTLPVVAAGLSTM